MKKIFVAKVFLPSTGVGVVLILLGVGVIVKGTVRSYLLPGDIKYYLGGCSIILGIVALLVTFFYYKKTK